MLYNATQKVIQLSGGREIVIETGKLAKQADGSVVVKQGNTMLLATVVAAKEPKPDCDFMPLSVEYKEKYAAAGRFPGGFLKREARPSDYEILVSRLIDRALRPLFPSDFHAEVFVQVNLISADKDIMPDALAGLAASAALAVSDVPFAGPISEVRVARINGELVINPTFTQNADADLDIMVGATYDNILMVEGEMKEVSEAEMLEAIKFAHAEIKKHCQAQMELSKELGKDVKRTYCHETNDEALREKVIAETYDKAYAIARERSAKHERSDKFDALTRIIDVEPEFYGIIFARTKIGADETASRLTARGYAAEVLHGDVSQAQREKILRKFRDRTINILVATDVAARGIDVGNLTHVINYSLPQDSESYVHRIGRTGRAGRTGTAITILEPREHRHLRAIESITKARIEVRSVPSATDVRARRLEMMRGSLAEILEAGDLDRFRVVVESLCEEYDPFDVAAAAMKLAQENEGANDDDTEIPAYSPFERPRRERGDKPVRGERAPRRERREAPEEGMTRLFVGAGRDLGIRPSDIVGAIANEAGVPSKCIGAIDITDRFTIVEVDSDRVEQIIDAMEGVRFKGRETTVKLDRPRREPREDRGDFRIEGRGEGRGEYRRERGEDRGWQQRDDSREYRGAKTKRDFRREGGYDKRGPRR